MGYLHIDNLYKNQEILMFRECYALEKVHGTSAHVSFHEGRVIYFSGGASHAAFRSLFDEAALLERFAALGFAPDQRVTVYGEAYGGKEQGMRLTYGPDLRFIAFDAAIGRGGTFLDVPAMEKVAVALGLDVVPYWRTSTDLSALDALRDQPSVVGERRGCPGRPSEGVVLRPLMELAKNNGDRIIAKHKGEAFSERKNTPKVDDPERLKVLSDAREIAEEWATPMRLEHVLDKIAKPWTPEQTPEVIRAMVADIRREADGEVIMGKESESAIGRVTARLYKERMQRALREDAPTSSTWSLNSPPSPQKRHR